MASTNINHYLEHLFETNSVPADSGNSHKRRAILISVIGAKAYGSVFPDSAFGENIHTAYDYAREPFCSAEIGHSWAIQISQLHLMRRWDIHKAFQGHTPPSIQHSPAHLHRTPSKGIWSTGHAPHIPKPECWCPAYSSGRLRIIFFWKRLVITLQACVEEDMQYLCIWHRPNRGCQVTIAHFYPVLPWGLQARPWHNERHHSKIGNEIRCPAQVLQADSKSL